MQKQIKMIQALADAEIASAEKLKKMATEAVTENDRERLYIEACENLSSAAKLREHVLNLIQIQHTIEEQQNG